MLKRLLVSIPLLLAGAVIVCLIVLMLTGPERVWHTFYGDSDLGPANFETLVRASTPNQYLVCPDGFCKNTIADRVSEVYPVTPEVLLSALSEIAAAGKNVRVIIDPAPDDFRFVERTGFFRFPDTVSVDVVAAGPGASMLAIFSRSQIGYSDLGVNKRRVRALVGALQQHLAAPE